jgi:hypothetical protein
LSSPSFRHLLFLLEAIVFWTFDLLGSVVLVLALCTVFLMVFVARAHKSGKDIPLWLGSGITGMLLGAAILAVGFTVMGYEAFTKEEVKEMAAAGLAAAQPLSTGTTTGPQAGGGGMGGGGMGGGGMGGGMGGMGGGGMGGGMGGGRQPSPKMLLGSLVRKLDLLTGDIQIRLTDSQATAVRQKLEELAAKSAMSDDEAKEAHDALLALLDDDQKARQDAVGLPMRRGGGGGPMGGGGGGGPMGGGGAPAADASPFAREDNSKALQSLVMRLGGTPAAAPTAEEKPAEEKPAEEKPAEAKPAAEKPAEAKPAEAKP